jgi:hypothetical protein
MLVAAWTRRWVCVSWIGLGSQVRLGRAESINRGGLNTFLGWTDCFTPLFRAPAGVKVHLLSISSYPVLSRQPLHQT